MHADNGLTERGQAGEFWHVNQKAQGGGNQYESFGPDFLSPEEIHHASRNNDGRSQLKIGTRLEVGKAQYRMGTHQDGQDQELFRRSKWDFAGGRLCREGFYAHSHLTLPISHTAPLASGIKQKAHRGVGCMGWLGKRSRLGRKLFSSAGGAAGEPLSRTMELPAGKSGETIAAVLSVFTTAERL